MACGAFFFSLENISYNVRRPIQKHSGIAGSTRNAIVVVLGTEAHKQRHSIQMRRNS